MRGVRRLLAIAASALLAASCTTTAPGANCWVPPAQTATAYRIHVGDAIEMRIFGEDFADGVYHVASNGAISLPLAGSLQVEGLTVEEFVDGVQTVYRDEFVTPPRVSAQIIASRPYYVLGEVNRPGSFDYQFGVTALAAVATAGGFNVWARKDCVLLRPGDGGPDRMLRTDARMSLSPGDVIYVEKY